MSEPDTSDEAQKEADAAAVELKLVLADLGIRTRDAAPSVQFLGMRVAPPKSGAPSKATFAT